MRAVILIKSDMETGKITQMFTMDARNQLLRRNPFLLGTQHNRRAMRIISTDIVDSMPLHFLETHPDICLNILNQMPQMDAAIGVRQRGSY